MSKRIDLTGQRFGDWRVDGYAHGSKWGACWRCICSYEECGEQRVILGQNLRNGRSRSCGRHRRPDLVGRLFGRWRIIHTLSSLWSLCVCEGPGCGTRRKVRTNNLLRDKTKSCGCWNQERRIKHGMTKTPTWNSWQAMKQRCNNPRAKDFEHYGGRGITYVERWEPFVGFFADMGERPPGTTNDRRNANGNYEPANCRWATASEQRRNRRSPGKRLSIKQLKRWGAPGPPARRERS